MRAKTVVTFFGAALVLGLSSTGCTLVSGVEDMELRGGPTPTPFGGGADGGQTEGAATNPPGSSAPAPQTGLAVCGAEGSWTDCDPAPALTTCAARCVARGLTCVEDCCAYDSAGDFRAKAGLIYAVAPALECAQASVSASGSGGLCSDPTLLSAGGAAQVRCCCK